MGTYPTDWVLVDIIKNEIHSESLHGLTMYIKCYILEIYDYHYLLVTDKYIPVTRRHVYTRH